jgi:N utilization substance protein A
MSNLKNYLFTSESVSEGHPDKVSDRISDMVVDSYLSGDPFSRVACETLTTTNKVVLAGEVRGPEIKQDELIEKVRNCIKDIGYDQDGFTWKEATKIESHLHSQSADIAMGVDSTGNKDEGAGDQGIMFGYACNETDVLMPAPIHYSHKILRLMAEDRKSGKLKNIEPDSKSQVTFEYVDGKPTKVKSVVISSQHSADVNQTQVRDLLRPYMLQSIPSNFLKGFNEDEFYVNPTGNFVIGGPDGDCGLTGRKIIVDTYGGAAPHGGGAFSGKDPTKVDRSAAYAARYIAKNIVAVALEKSIDKELIISSMETGIAKAAKSKFGQENEIKVSINRDNGEIEIFRKLIVAENPENSNTEIKLEDAIDLNETNKDKAVGDEVLQPLPSFDFGRIAAQTAKQVISFNVREAERERQYNDFIDKKDTILSGIVKRLEFGNVIADLGRTEAIIQKNEMIPRENIKAGDRIKAYCYDVRREPRGQQIFLSRAHPKFMEKLFVQEVPEIYDGLIEIKSSSRDPGSRAKICVKAVDTSLDPVGACVGMRGSRVQAVVNELQGEKIDIVNWSEDPAILVSNALSPAEVQRVNVDSERKKLDVILTEENLSKAIGRRGQNVRLATKLLNYEINIMTDAEDSERRQSEFKEKTDNFVKNLELDETLGQLLVAEGFSSIDDIKDTTAESLMKIEGIEEDTAKALIERAKEFHQKDQEDISQRIKELGLQDALINLKGLTPGMLMTLGDQKILTLEDFADLASDELTGGYDIVKGERVKIQGYLEDFALSKEESDELIMSARNIVYKD